MKKFITYTLAVVLALAVSAPLSMAQERDAATQEEIDSLRQSLELANQELNRRNLDAKYKQIWNKGKYTMLGYALQDMGTDYNPVMKSKYSFFIAKGTTYYFPKRPIAGMVKIGLDMRWTDISVARFENQNIASDNWDMLGSGSNEDGYDEDESDLLERFSNLGRWNMQISALGVGVNVGIAPLSMFDNAAKYLRASVYFHYLPTFGAILVSEDGKTEASFAYCNMFDFGGKLTYRAFSVGVEGRWGSGKFKPLELDIDEDGEGIGFDSDTKIKRNFASTRFYVAFTF